MPTDRKPDPDSQDVASDPRRGAAAVESPTIDSARRRLGGLASGSSREIPGGLVEVRLRGGETRLGVLLWATDRECDVWLDDGIARRTAASTVSRHAGPMPAALTHVAIDLCLFLRLAEGDPVCWERSAEVAHGWIAQKCRYGAIVVTSNAKIVAVGFRRLWPATVQALA